VENTLKKDGTIQTRLEAEERASQVRRQATREVSLERVLGRVNGSDEARLLLQRLKPFMGQAPNFSSLHAAYIVTSVFSAFASDEVNVGKMTRTLDAAITELQALSLFLKGLLD
jgi:hypothetical protein